jgi:hypothetical protein
MAGQVPVNVRTQRMIRLFLQPGGPGQNNPLALEGGGVGYAALTGRTRAVRGGIENIPVYNPSGPGYVNTGSMEKPPSFGEVTLELRETMTGLSLADTLEFCPTSIYEIAGGDCNIPSDHLLGYANLGKVSVYGDCKVTDNIDNGDGMAFTDDNPLSAKIKFAVTGDQFAHGQEFFASLATATASDLLTSLVTDCTYGNKTQCGNCGVPNDGTYLKYWSLRSTTTSPGGKPGIIYQLGTATPVYQSVTSAAIAEDLTFIGTVGPYLVVGSSTAGGAGIGGYHYATIGATGVPGTWTKVVTGFQSNKEPTDMLVLSDSEVYFSGNGGYIYKSVNIPAGVTTNNAGTATTANLSRIAGNRQLMVAVGATGTIIYSNNGAKSWASVPTTPSFSTPTVQGVDVIGINVIWVTTSTGRVFATQDAGNSWTETTFDSSSSGSVTDVYFVNSHEGYFLHNTSGNVGRIFRTYNGGASWWNQSPAIESLGSYYALQRIAAPQQGNMTVRSNNVIVAGSDTATKGLLLSGTPAVF